MRLLTICEHMVTVPSVLIDAIADSFAIEHTSVDSVLNQRRDSDGSCGWSVA
jgi:hypothetical protein